MVAPRGFASLALLSHFLPLRAFFMPLPFLAAPVRGGTSIGFRMLRYQRGT
jgi:hypothetical protein